MENIKNLIKRIGAEAETVEDMEQLLLSELEAYEKFQKHNTGKITLYAESKLVGNFAIIGNIDKYAIILTQKMGHNKLISNYMVAENTQFMTEN